MRAVDGIDLDVRAGDVYGFLGANGSGKTTTVRMLLGLVLPTSGEIELLGRADAAGRRAGCCRGSARWSRARPRYGHLSGRENLRAARRRPGPAAPRRTRRRRIDEALEQVGLAGVGRRPVKAYSLGMRQRLGLAGALLRRPELLVLDEPTNGLDPQGIAEIRELLLDLHRAGTTVFLSSHLLAEVEQLCTRVGVLDRGRLVLQDELAALHRPDRRDRGRARPDPTGCAAPLDGRVERRRRRPAGRPRRRPGRGERAAGRRRGAGHRAGARSGRRSSRSCSPRPGPAPTGWRRRR